MTGQEEEEEEEEERMREPNGDPSWAWMSEQTMMGGCV